MYEHLFNISMRILLQLFRNYLWWAHVRGVQYTKFVKTVPCVQKRIYTNTLCQDFIPLDAFHRHGVPNIHSQQCVSKATCNTYKQNSGLSILHHAGVICWNVRHSTLYLWTLKWFKPRRHPFWTYYISLHSDTIIRSDSEYGRPKVEGLKACLSSLGRFCTWKAGI
jgi:hypothetical protein